MKDDKLYKSIAGLKCSGWTNGAIKKFLGESDKEVKNRYYSSAAPIKLYCVDRITTTEQTEEWLEWQKSYLLKKDSLKKRAEKAVLTKVNNLLEEVKEEYEPYVEKFPPDKLVKYAIQHYNDLWFYRGKDKIASISSDEEFLIRIAENFLRHTTSNYDGCVDSTTGKCGKDMAYFYIRELIDDEIKNIYPDIGSYVRTGISILKNKKEVKKEKKKKKKAELQKVG